MLMYYYNPMWSSSNTVVYTSGVCR